MWSTKDVVGGRQRDRGTERQRDRETEGQRGDIEKYQVEISLSRSVELRGERGRKNREENTIIFFCKGWLRGQKPMA